MSVVLPPNVIATGDSASAARVRYSFIAPPDAWIFEAFLGMLYDYSQVGTWYQVGTATPADAAEIVAAAWATFGVDMATTGAIIPFAGFPLPIGWLACDGASYLRTDYQELFGAIGTSWGSVDGTHFNVPDLRGRALLGTGVAASGTVYSLADEAGEEKHQLTVAELASHQHSTGNSAILGTSAPPPLDALGPNPFPAGTGFTGGDVPHENRQPYAAVNYAIVT